MSASLQPIVRFLQEREPWKEEAACRDMDPDLFFPGRGSSTRAAKQACADCSVQLACADYARRTGSEGIWAGQTRQSSALMPEPRNAHAS